MAGLSYDYQAQTGQPPSGKAYQSAGALGLLAISYVDQSGNNNDLLLREAKVGSTIVCNGVTWTITSMQFKGSNVVFGITPAVAAPPYGVATFTYAPPTPADAFAIYPPLRTSDVGVAPDGSIWLTQNGQFVQITGPSTVIAAKLRAN